MDKPAAGKSQGECAKADLRSRSQVGRPPSMARPSTTSPTLIVSSLSAYATAADFCHAPRELPVRGFISFRSWGVHGTGTGWNWSAAGRGEHRGQSFCGLLRLVP